ncbi:MAG: S53 family peptidase [Acidobacteriota bacterium]|nr:S53 family peptidase [Blastocatellia bacterium]MDW8412971.1 S53 family peptidase [Acidobacteriota bacterium]
MIIAAFLLFFLPQGFLLEEPVPDDALALGPLDTGEQVTGQLLFRLRDEEELEELIARQNDPLSPDYRRWLRPEEFAERFAVAADTYESACNWLIANGLQVKKRWKGRHALEFTGRAAVVERVFGVRIEGFLQKGQRRYAARGSVQLPVDLAKSVYGVRISSLVRMQPVLAATDIRPATAVAGRVAVAAEDFYLAYNLLPLLKDGIDGRGQKIGIVARCDFDLSDVALYRSTFGLPEGRITKIAAAGRTINYGGIEETEVLLNAQLAGMAAPGAEIQVVIAEAGAEIDQSLAYFVNELPETRLINISFGLCERDLGQTFQSVFANLYKQAAAQGQSVFVAAGNGGANDCRDGSGRQVNGLASSPYVTAVGGTTLQLEYDPQGKPVRFLSERAWTNGGGGLSLIYNRPSYQRDLQIEGAMRAIPDVSLMADPGPGYFIVRRGSVFTVGGTSAATPCWVGIFALANQLVSGKGFGPANYLIYKLGEQQIRGAVQAFRDISVGNNSSFGVAGFEAAPGYDLCTGWGTANADVLVRQLSAAENFGQVYLLFPNGGEFLNADSFAVRWHLSSDIVDQVLSQTLLLSTDGGASFVTVAEGLDPRQRSFEFKRGSLVATAARFKVAVLTSTAILSDTSDANFNLGSNLRIEFATYAAKQLKLEGTGFAKEAKLVVNGREIKKSGKLVSEDELVFKGTEKKFGLKPGPNELLLRIGKVVSAPFILFLKQ